MSGATATASVRDIIDLGMMRSVYQPIVDLDSGDVVAYEALARGPMHTEFESPTRLFQEAAAQGLTVELDWACVAAAFSGALEAGLDRATRLFVNVEPARLGAPRPRHFDALIETARAELSIVAEVTERALTDNPAALVRALASARASGLGIAIDDVGAERSSLALLPFVAPDVIKLDMRLVQDRTDSEVAAIAGAVRSDAERRGAIVLAEGIETAEHVDRAHVLGARLGQGWFFGRPGALHARSSSGAGRRPFPLTLGPAQLATTPWSLVAGSPGCRTASKELLMPMSHHIEQRALTSDPCLVLSAFQDIDFFTSATRIRYEDLARRHCLVGAIGTRMGPSPGTGVRGGTVEAGHPVSGEWTVTVVSAHEAVALIAREVEIPRDDGRRMFDYVITHDRDTVIAAARSLMQYLDVV